MDTTISFAQITCYKCGIPFLVPSYFKEKRINNHENFWCPNGHMQAFVGKTEAEKLREQLRAQQSRMQTLERELIEERERCRHPELSERQQEQAQWLVDNVQGIGWTRAEAIIAEYGTVQAFIEESDDERASVALGMRLQRSVLPDTVRSWIERTRGSRKMLPAAAGPDR